MEPRHLLSEEGIEELYLEDVQEQVHQAEQFMGDLPDPFEEVLGG